MSDETGLPQLLAMMQEMSAAIRVLTENQDQLMRQQNHNGKANRPAGARAFFEGGKLFAVDDELSERFLAESAPARQVGPDARHKPAQSGAGALQILCFVRRDAARTE